MRTLKSVERLRKAHELLGNMLLAIDRLMANDADGVTLMALNSVALVLLESTLSNVISMIEKLEGQKGVMS